MFPHTLQHIIMAEHAAYRTLEYHLFHPLTKREPTFTRLACPLENADPLGLRPEPIGENTIEFAQYARKMRDWRRRGETTRISKATHPIEWEWAQGKPALGFRPECVAVDWEYLPADEQLAYLTNTSVATETTFLLGETLDTRASDPVPDYLRAREVGLSLTSSELAFAFDDDSDDGDVAPGGEMLDESGLCRPRNIDNLDRFGWAPPTPYMRSWVDWEKRRKYSGTPIHAYPIQKGEQMDIQVEGIPRLDGNSTALIREEHRRKAAMLLVEGGLTRYTWQDYVDWVDWNHDESRSIGLTKAQAELYYQAPAQEIEQERATWPDLLYHGVYEADEELTDEQMRNQQEPQRYLYLRTHADAFSAEMAMRPEHNNSPEDLGLLFPTE